MNRGKYIVLEGDEAAGKTSQLPRVQTILRARSILAEIVREPGGDPFAESLRQILKHAEYAITPEAEALAFSAARASMLQNVVRPLLGSGTWVLADRCYISTLVSQGLGHGLDSPAFRRVVKYAIQPAAPDLVIVIDISLAESQRRQKARKLALDRFDVSESFRRKVNDGYRNLKPDRQLVHINGHGTPEEVESRLLGAISRFFN